MKFVRMLPARIAGICIAFGMALAATSFSAAAEDQVVMVVNGGRLQAETLAGKDIIRQLKEYQEQLYAPLESEKKGIEKKATDLAKQKQDLLITEAAFAQQARALAQEDREFKGKAGTAELRLRQAQFLANKAFNEAAEPILLQLVKESKGTVLLDQSQVVYFNPDIDITEDAIKRMDKVLKTLAVDLEPKPAEGEAAKN